jgi:hypothetical protein
MYTCGERWLVMVKEISLEERLESCFTGRTIKLDDGTTFTTSKVYVDIDYVVKDVVSFFKTLESNVKTLALKENAQYLTIGITKSVPKGSGIVSFTADFEGEHFTKFVLYRSAGRDGNTFIWEANDVHTCIGGVLTRKYTQEIMLDIFRRI